MLHTVLTENWHLRYPIIGAPMAGVGGGKLAGAVTAAGGLGMIGVGSGDSVDFLAREAAVARGEYGQRFGIGLMAWAIARRPELLDAAIHARPFLVSISFGDVREYVSPLHEAGILVASQVHDRQEAEAAAAAGVDLLVAQGTEAGGHTGQISTLPLLQIVLEMTEIPVVAAGGIGSARGLAAVLAAGAEGGWIGSAFLGSPETTAAPEARRRVVQASETDTVLTHVFDWAQGLPWPEAFPGRALQNSFTAAWHERQDELHGNVDVAAELAAGRERRDFDTAYIYAGQAVGLVTRERPAGEVVRELGEGAEALLRSRFHALLRGSASASP